MKQNKSRKAAAPSVRRIAVIEAPTPLGLRPPSPGHIPGTRLMPEVLGNAGLLHEVPLAEHIVLPEPGYVFEPDDSSGIRNHMEVARFTQSLDGVTTEAIRSGHTPIIIGGDCSVLLGPAVALKRLGRYSLVHIDGHNDFGHDGNWGKPYASIAGADLAVVTGRGPGTLTNLYGLSPYFRDEDVVQFGEKADSQSPDYWFKDFPLTAIRRMPLTAIRGKGVKAALDDLERLLVEAPTEGYWMHIDLDVLDSALMPAVDSPESPGLSWEELEAVLNRLTASSKLVGLNIGIYDPELDPSRTYARHISAMLRQCLLKMSLGDA